LQTIENNTNQETGKRGKKRGENRGNFQLGVFVFCEVIALLFALKTITHQKKNRNWKITQQKTRQMKTILCPFFEVFSSERRDTRVSVGAFPIGFDNGRQTPVKLRLRRPRSVPRLRRRRRGPPIHSSRSSPQISD